MRCRCEGQRRAAWVGAGPAGLACAIELAGLVKRGQESGGGMPDVGIAVLEKAGSLGEHNLSGAVVNPRAMRELFPDRAPSDGPNMIRLQDMKKLLAGLKALDELTKAEV